MMDPFGHSWLIATVREKIGPQGLAERFRQMTSGSSES
jgi:hypothetical protein